MTIRPDDRFSADFRTREGEVILQILAAKTRLDDAPAELGMSLRAFEVYRHRIIDRIRTAMAASR